MNVEKCVYDSQEVVLSVAIEFASKIQRVPPPRATAPCHHRILL